MHAFFLVCTYMYVVPVVRVAPGIVGAHVFKFYSFLAGTASHVITSHLGQTESAFPAQHLVSYVLNDLGSSCDFPSGGEVSRPCCMFGGASTNTPWMISCVAL